MRLVDLTLPVVPTPDKPVVRREDWPLGHGGLRYSARVYHFDHDSMAGTYLDLPGHIRETDDGRDAESQPPESLFRLEARVARLDRAGGSGGITAGELAAAAGPGAAPCLILNALGARRFDDIPERSVWLTMDAVHWIIAAGVALLVSDVYERNPPLGVFYELFRAGVATVCHPVNLGQVFGARVRVTVLMPRFRGVTQLACRVLAECESNAEG